MPIYFAWFTTALLSVGGDARDQNLPQSGRLLYCVISGVVSRGRCNTGLQSIGRSFKSQCFSWPLIEAQGNLVQVGLRVAGQIRLLRQVLPQQPRGCLVRTR